MSKRLDSQQDASTTYPVWNNFFITAGIPSSVANEYAITFSQHRIRMDMLKDLTKEILYDLNIRAMGDVISILRHAKNLYTQDELKVTPKTIVTNTYNTPTIKTPPAPPPTTTTTTAAKNYKQPINKIQSRVSLNSGALIASSSLSSPSQSFETTSSYHKRQNSSTISESLSKRLKPATDNKAFIGAGIGRNLPEKTLTVHYPSGAAIAKAQQRIGLANNDSSRPIHDNKQTSSASSSLYSNKINAINQRIRDRDRHRERNTDRSSIKSRLGIRSHRTKTVNNNSNNKHNNRV